MADKSNFEGGCHCGRVRFRVKAELVAATECNCSICTKKGFLHLVVPPEDFELVQGREELTTYRFNTGLAQHTFERKTALTSSSTRRDKNGTQEHASFCAHYGVSCNTERWQSG